MAATLEAAPRAAAVAPADGSQASWLADPRNRLIALGGGLAAIGLITWLVIFSGNRKENYAAHALDQARNLAESGNLPQAASEFQKLITTYGGTRASQEAVIALNQVRLLNDQSELAVVGLQDFLKTNPDAQFRAPAQALLGRALENAKRPGEAAKAYMEAVQAADEDYLKADYLLDAGRAYADAGEKDKAADAFRRIVKEFSKTSAGTEGLVRLAEVTGGAM